jgi:hypothetical protein
MALGWGDNAWGEYGWGGAIATTGNEAVSTVGTATPIGSLAITGVNASGAVGTVVQSQLVAGVGNSATASVGTVGSASVTLALTGVGAVGLVGFGWGQGAWGDNPWGGSSLGFTEEYSGAGVSATGAVGSVGVAERFIAITGVSASGVAGTVAGLYAMELTGVGGVGSVGTVGVANTLGLTGNVAFGQASQVIVPLNSNEASAFVGTVAYGIAIELTGVSASGAVRPMGLIRTHSLTGNLATGNVGNVTAVYWKIIDDNQPTTWQNINTS